MDNLKLAVVWDVLFSPQHHHVICTVNYVQRRVVVSAIVCSASFEYNAKPFLQSLGLPLYALVSTWHTSREPQHKDHTAAWASFVKCFLVRHKLQVTPWKNITSMTIECIQEITQNTFTCTVRFDEQLPPMTLDPLKAWNWSNLPPHA